jgi:cleavage and polyadenylation specificity factor subunit 3
MQEVGIEEDEEVDEVMEITPLGGGQEVGRSCILLRFKGRTILLDCGIHPGREGLDAYPFFDEVDPAEVDLILITHFHIDHSASLPYFTEKTNFKGRILMTHATKAVMRLLVSDYIKLLGGGSSKSSSGMYSDIDLLNCVDKIEVVDFHQTVEHRGIKICAYAAGHVLGAAMFTVCIDGVVVLYTGDYSMEEDRYL